MKTDRVRVGLGPTGEGIGVLFDRRLYGSSDLIDREPSAPPGRLKPDATVDRAGVRRPDPLRRLGGRSAHGAEYVGVESGKR